MEEMGASYRLPASRHTTAPFMDLINVWQSFGSPTGFEDCFPVELAQIPMLFAIERPDFAVRVALRSTSSTIPVHRCPVEARTKSIKIDTMWAPLPPRVGDTV